MRPYRLTDWTTPPQILDHVLIYGLTVPVVYVCVCVCGVHACVFVVEHFLLFSLQARRGSHVESNSVILGNNPASSDVSVTFRGICQGQYLLHLH